MKANYSSAEYNAALQKLRSFLDSSEPEVVYFLTNMWGAQGNAITYKELREAILAGELSAELINEWRQDYAKFVDEHLRDAWEEAMKAATDDLAAKYPDWYFNPMADEIVRWTKTHSAEFITNVTEAQIDGLSAVIERAAGINGRNVDNLARAIRPMVGLYKQQAISNLNYYNKLIENGVSEQKALDLSIRYSARQQRHRAYMISRTELAFAYNKGMDEGIRQAQAMGYMGKMVKIWCTARDERRCDTCRSLEGKVIDMDGEFNFKTNLKLSGIKRTPPAHPGCRCTTLYKEIPVKNR